MGVLAWRAYILCVQGHVLMVTLIVMGDCVREVGRTVGRIWRYFNPVCTLPSINEDISRR
jgi:hypothetical protein